MKVGDTVWMVHTSFYGARYERRMCIASVYKNGNVTVDHPTLKGQQFRPSRDGTSAHATGNSDFRRAYLALETPELLERINEEKRKLDRSRRLQVIKNRIHVATNMDETQLTAIEAALGIVRS